MEGVYLRKDAWTIHGFGLTIPVILACPEGTENVRGSDVAEFLGYKQKKGEGNLKSVLDNHGPHFAEPVPDSRAKGGRPASRKDTDIMPRDKSKTPVTKGQILLWHAKALQAELSQERDKAALKL